MSGDPARQEPHMINLRTAAIPAAILALAASIACGMMRIDIVGTSMEPTLMDGSSVVGTQQFDTIERGDIVGVRDPRDESRSIVQRVVGLPGERVLSLEGRISVNGQVLDEAYVAAGNRSTDSWGPLALGNDEYFMMGDNRSGSTDSRRWGPIKRTAIWVKVVN
jgi:signal peptidase I